MATPRVEVNTCADADTKSRPEETTSYSSSHRSSRIIDQRKARRFQVCSPATVRWLGNDDLVHEVAGMVRDISTCGAFVEAAVSLRINNNVEVEINPFGLRSGSPKTELHFEGKVVRNEQHAPRPGFAIAGFLWLAKLEVRVC